MCICHIPLIQSSVDGQLGYFHRSAVAENAALNVDGSDDFVFLLSSSVTCRTAGVDLWVVPCHFSSICSLLQDAVK